MGVAAAALCSSSLCVFPATSHTGTQSISYIVVDRRADPMNCEDIDEDTLEGYSGTFRWKKEKRLPSLPTTATTVADDKEHLDEAMKGWMQYLVTRCETPAECNSIITGAKKDMSLIDCLSPALTVGYSLVELNIFPHLLSEDLVIVCMGCSSKCEERILRETNCWAELQRFVDVRSRCKVWLLGPEMSETKDDFSSSNNVSFGLFKGTAIEFFRLYPKLLSSKIVVVGMNCGFGNWENPLPIRYDLLFDWLPDLYFLTGTKIPLVFSCANDFADASGESGIMHRIMGANFLFTPRENPFGFASTLIPPGVKPQDAERLYTRGNSFIYSVLGCDKTRRVTVNTKKKSTRTAEFVSMYNRKGLPIEFSATKLQWQKTPKMNLGEPSCLNKETVQVSEVVDSNYAVSRNNAVTPHIEAVSNLDLRDSILVEDNALEKASEKSIDIIDNSIRITQTLDEDTSLIADIELVGTDTIDSALTDINISYSESSGEFLLTVGTISGRVKSIKPIVQSTVTAKLKKKKKCLHLRAGVIPPVA